PREILARRARVPGNAEWRRELSSRIGGGDTVHGAEAQLTGSRSSRSLILTRETVFTRLFARTKLPSRVTEVLRTMLPPPGIAQLWNLSAFGSNRTTVFGFVPDSLYQITSLIAEIP